MADVFETREELATHLFRIVDNGGLTADRYTVIFTDGSYLDLSSDPGVPNGISTWGERIDPMNAEVWVEGGNWIDLAMGDLPHEVLVHVTRRANEALEDLLASVEDHDPSCVAPDRDAAQDNEGTHDSLGKGIYLDGDAFKIRVEGDASNDFGPFVTAREAILATIPDADALSGTDFQASVDVARTKSDINVLKSIEALEAKVALSERPNGPAV